MTEVKRSYCGLCHPRCGLLLEVEQGRIVKVQGDPEHPVTRGRICERGRLMADHVHHPDRLNHPLKRIGERGSGRWQRLTWDQRRFYNLFGSPNTCGANNICMCPRQAVEYATYGGFSHGDVRQAKCVVLWGHGPSLSGPVGLYPAILQAKKGGARLIVVDPRRIPEAEKADMWLQIRPGDDVALMLGWLWSVRPEALAGFLEETGWTHDSKNADRAGRHGVEYFAVAKKCLSDSRSKHANARGLSAGQSSHGPGKNSLKK